MIGYHILKTTQESGRIRINATGFRQSFKHGRE